MPVTRQSYTISTPSSQVLLPPTQSFDNRSNNSKTQFDVYTDKKPQNPRLGDESPYQSSDTKQANLYKKFQMKLTGNASQD